MRVYYRHILDVIIVNYFKEIRLGFQNQIYVGFFFISQQLKRKFHAYERTKKELGRFLFLVLKLIHKI